VNVCEETASTPTTSTESLVVHLARLLAMPGSAEETVTLAGAGPSSYVLLATLSPAGGWEKAQLAFSLCDTATEARPLGELSPPYPRWGIASCGELGALEVWAPPIDGSASSSLDDAWPTPTVPNGGRVLGPGMSRTGMMPDGTKRQVDLAHAAKTWPTPMQADAERSSHTMMRGNPTLLGAVAAWPTPSASDGMGGRTLPEGTTATDLTPDGKKRMVGLNNAVVWPTPRASDGEKGGASQRHGDGSLTLSSMAAQEAPPKGQLSSRWVSQLQGLPPDYLDIAGPPVPAKSSTRTKRPG